MLHSVSEYIEYLKHNLNYDRHKAKNYSEESVDLILLDLSKYGYVKLESFVNQDTCYKIRKFIMKGVRNRLDLQGIQYQEHENFTQILSDAFGVEYFGNMAVGQHDPQIMDLLRSFVLHPVVTGVAQRYLGDEAVHMSRLQLNQTRKTPPTLFSAIPFVPHYDRVRFLKFYLYLEDTDVDHGAFSICGQNWVDEVEKLRASAKDQGLTWKEQCGEKLTGFKGSLEPVEGKAGTLIIFDSNQPHQHGAITSRKPRHVLIVESQTESEIGYAYNSDLLKYL